MLYRLLLFPARIFIHFYCRKIFINDEDKLNLEGPLLIACNHPNSFLDAIILASLFKKPIYSLARGDAFANKFISGILKSFNMLPVYRLSEGAENLGHNYSTFNSCQEIFEKNGIVLIFSEGRCLHEWHLRPLKKGTARLALTAWQDNVPLKVLPTAINYNGFRNFGKVIFLKLGDVITKEKNYTTIGGKAINEFNDTLKEQLQKLVFEIDANDHKKIEKIFHIHQPSLKKILLFIPAICGYIIYFPLYYLIHLAIKNKAKEHYDSIMIGLWFFIFPIFVLALTLVVFFITHSLVSLLSLLILPFFALSILHFKKY